MSDELSEQQEETLVEEKPKRKRKKLVDVTIIARQGQSALVQWAMPGTKKVARGYIEASEIESDNRCDVKVLEAAQPYGVPWGKLIDAIEVTPERVEAELYRHNIWTVADLESGAQQAIRVLTLIVGPIIGELHQRGRDHERFEKEEGKYNAITE